MTKVLLVEDDLDIQTVYSQKLEMAGFKVILSSDAHQALNIIKTDAPDILLLDIMLPGKFNGFDLLEWLKKDDKMKNMPVIVLTNLDTEKESALKIGANDYLIKANTNLNEIVDKIKKYT